MTKRPLIPEDAYLSIDIGYLAMKTKCVTLEYPVRAKFRLWLGNIRRNDAPQTARAFGNRCGLAIRSPMALLPSGRALRAHVYSAAPCRRRMFNANGACRSVHLGQLPFPLFKTVTL
jgi:hypothetical protein